MHGLWCTYICMRVSPSLEKIIKCEQQVALLFISVINSQFEILGLHLLKFLADLFLWERCMHASACTRLAIIETDVTAKEQSTSLSKILGDTQAPSYPINARSMTTIIAKHLMRTDCLTILILAGMSHVMVDSPASWCTLQQDSVNPTHCIIAKLIVNRHQVGRIASLAPQN